MSRFRFLLCAATALVSAAPMTAQAQSDWQYRLVTAPNFQPYPYDIANDGAIVGETQDSNFGFIQKGGVNTAVYVPGSGETFLTGVANNGSMSASVWNADFSRTDGAVRAPDGTITYLPASDVHNWGMGINDSGTVVGYASDANYQNFQALVWSGGGVAAYAFPGANSTYAFGINNTGIAVGYADGGPGHQGGFLLQNGVFTAFDYPGAVLSAVSDINEKNQLVGVFNSSDNIEHAYFYSNGVFTATDFPDVASQFPAFLNIGGDIYTQSGVTDTQPLGMNDRGDFVGFIAAGYNAPDGSFAGYLKQGFVATAVPEPGVPLTAALISLTIAGLVRRKRVF